MTSDSRTSTPGLRDNVTFGFDRLNDLLVALVEGPEGVKWELGFGHFFAGKMGFHALGLGFINKKTIENGNMGLRFEQDRHSDDGICAVGRWDVVKIWDGKWE